MSLEPCPRAIVGGTLIDGTGRPALRDSVLVIKDEWIVSVGRRGEVPIPPGSEVIDASGKTVLPGLIDAHCHFLSMGIRMLQFIELRDAATLSDALNKVKERLGKTPKGEWVRGKGWDESKWPERRYITKQDLDSFSPDHPVMLRRICGHLISVNSRALRMAGITRDTPDPPRGKIDRGPDGEPTGIIRDAAELIDRVTPPNTEGVAIEGLGVASDLALSLGCTSIQDAGLDAFEMGAYQSANERGNLKVRSYMMVDDELMGAASDLGLRTGFGGEMVRLGPIKFVFDGSMGARTAYLYEPYEDDPGNKGILLIEPDKLNEQVRDVHGRGWQVAIHAIGDKAIEYAIDAIEGALREAPRKDHRHRIEHCELLTASQIERIRQLGIIASVQPNFVGEWSGPGGLYEFRIGKKRLRMNNPYRTLLDEGVHVAFGSDGMPFNPIYGIWSAVNHPVKESRITLEEAVKSYTLDAAYSSFEEALKGSVEPGKLADIVILKEDLTRIPPEKIKDVRVHLTMLNGKILYYLEER